MYTPKCLNAALPCDVQEKDGGEAIAWLEDAALQFEITNPVGVRTYCGVLEVSV